MTPLADPNQTQSIIQHLNDAHRDGVLSLAKTFVSSDTSEAWIHDLFEEGIIVSTPTQQQFVSFMLHSDADKCEQIHYLIFYARVQQGAMIDGGDYRYFTVLKNEKVSPHIQRLILQSQLPMPEHEAGLAWYFTLQTMKRQPENDFWAIWRQRYHHIVMYLLRYLKAAQRHQILNHFYAGKRYYTVRETRKSSNNQLFDDIAVVDVFLHGQSTGSLWAQNLRKGDVIRSTAQYREQINHLATGQVLLIGDETALPTLCALLANWQNSIAPIVICITQDEADQIYLCNKILPINTQLFRLNSRQNLPEAVSGCLKKIAHIDKVWGALEADDAKQIRDFLKQNFHLQGQNVKVKGYWRKDKS